MEDSWYTYRFILVGGILFVLGAVFGTSCLYVIIPLALAISVLYWFIIRKRDNECSKSVASGLFAILAVTAFVMVFLGSCLGGCVTGKSDARQQRIEMGMTPY